MHSIPEEGMVLQELAGLDQRYLVGSLIPEEEIYLGIIVMLL